MKKFLAGILVAGVITTLPMSAMAENVQNYQKEKTVVLAPTGTLSKEEVKALKANSKKQENYRSIILPETKSPNYQFSLPAFSYADSPAFTHASGDILVTLVQYNSGWGSPTLLWSIVTEQGFSTGHSIEVPDEYDDTNFTINFGSIPAGKYKIRVSNAQETAASGNYFIYY